MPKHSKSTAISSEDSGSEQEFSGSENEPTWEQAKNFKLRFGRYKGKRLCQLITTKKRRNYLTYLLKWDSLREDGRGNIKCVMEHYQEMKAAASKEFYSDCLPSVTCNIKNPLIRMIIKGDKHRVR